RVASLYVRSALAMVVFASALSAQLNVLTANYGNDRTNTNLAEQILTASNVSPDTFGKVGAFPVDGQIYAQPLYVHGASVGGSTRNVLYVATMRNTIYAFDADTPGSKPLWSVNLGQPVPSAFLNFVDAGPEIGILGTPVIDLGRNALYLVTDTLTQDIPAFRLHALDLTTGGEKLGGPVEIRGLVEGDGDATQDGKS